MKILAAILSLIWLSLAADAQKAVVPIVSLTTLESGGSSSIIDANLLGGVENGRWLDAKTAFGKLKAGQRYSLFDFQNGAQGEFLLGEFETGGISCSKTFFLKPNLKAVAADFAVGANAGWEVMPRRAKAVSPARAADRKAVADFLKLRGLRKSPATVEQAFEIDLDGDGTDETVLSAGHYIGEGGETEPEIGTYSFLLVRKTIGGKARTLFVGGNLIANKRDYYDGDYEVSGFADLNGDGKMEIIANVGGYEENGKKVFELKAGKWREVEALAYFCGLGTE
jgi:hypothetical protein